MLPDKSQRRRYRPWDDTVTDPRSHALERFLAIYREDGEVEMDFSDPSDLPVPPLGRISTLKGRISAACRRFRAGVSRRWLWNVSYPLKMWFHMRFRREKPLPGGERYIEALLRDAFAAEGITDGDFLCPPVDLYGHETPVSGKRRAKTA